MRSNIGLKKATADSASAVLIRDDSWCTVKEYSARVMRTATLDGGAVIENLGYSDGDRNITIVTEAHPDIIAKIKSLIVDELFIIVSTRDGVYYGAIDSLVSDRDQINLTILIQERDDA